MIQQSLRLKYEPASKPLHIYVDRVLHQLTKTHFPGTDLARIINLPGANSGRVSQPPFGRHLVQICSLGLYDPCKARLYPSRSFFTVVLHKSIPTRIRQLILYISNSTG